jgi:hypothetical protein
MTKFTEGFEKRATSRMGLFTGKNIFTHSVLPGVAGGAVGALASDEHPLAGGLAGAALGAGAGLGVLGLRNRSAYKNLLRTTKNLKRYTSELRKTQANINMLRGDFHKANREYRSAQVASAGQSSINTIPPDDLLSHAEETFHLHDNLSAKSGILTKAKKDYGAAIVSQMPLVERGVVTAKEQADALKWFPGKI